VTGPRAWPETPEALAAEQARLAGLRPPPWRLPPAAVLRPDLVGACAVVFGRAGGDGTGWAAAVLMRRGELVAAATRTAPVGAPFEPGRLALREGPLLEDVVRRLPLPPEVLLVAAAGRDHPRRAGPALPLGAVLGVPTAGVTDDPLVGRAEPPGPAWMDRSPLRIGDEVVGYLVRTRKGAKPVVAHAAWRTSPEIAAEVVLGDTSLARWPESLREARRLAREARAAANAPPRR
jgi:deoxyribonuclease V